MIPHALGDPCRPAHQEILEDEQTWEDHVVDVFPRCRPIMEIVHTSIDIRLFPDGPDVRDVLDALIREARETLQYRKQCENKGARDRHAQ